MVEAAVEAELGQPAASEKFTAQAGPLPCPGSVR
jgi:hypothetical protein